MYFFLPQILRTILCTLLLEIMSVAAGQTLLEAFRKDNVTFNFTWEFNYFSCQTKIKPSTN